MTKKKAEKWKPIRRMTEEEMKQTVKDMADGELIFVEPNNIHTQCPFLVLGAGNATREFAESVGAVLGDKKSIAPMAVNGLPMFFGVKMVNKDDWPIIAKSYNAELKKREVQVELVR